MTIAKLIEAGRALTSAVHFVLTEKVSDSARRQLADGVNEYERALAAVERGEHINYDAATAVRCSYPHEGMAAHARAIVDAALRGTR